MTEKERKRRRQELEKRMKARQKGRKDNGGGKGFFIFRLYVTAILTGTLLVVSFFQSETSLKVCSNIKAAIANQIAREDMVQAKQRLMAWLKESELSLPVFQETEEAPQSVYKPDLEESP